MITFEENPPIDFGAGQIIDDEYDSNTYGYMLVSAVANEQVKDFAVIFDSDNPTGNDPDLATPGTLGNAAADSLHNLLIIQTNTGGLAAVGNHINIDPNDHADGGTITFTWAVPVFDFFFTFVDMEDEEISESSIQFFTSAADVVPFAELPFALFDGVSGIDYGENSVNLFSLADVNLALASETGGVGPFYSRKITFNLSSSGAIGSIGYNAVPEPGAVVLFGTGLLALAAVARRRSARRT